MSNRPDDRLRILVLGYIVRCPLGGMTWHYLQYALGLARLGHDVCFIEDSEDYPACYDPSRHIIDTDPSFGLEYARGVFERYGLGERWSYYDRHRDQWHGPLASSMPRACREADVLVNISGICPLRDWLQDVPVRIFIDTDPAFEQIRQLTVPERRDRAAQHTAFFTFGENIPAGLADLPDDGLLWQATRQPIVLDLWKATPGRPGAPLTSVMQWDSYAPREYAGRAYGMKSESFAPLAELPRRAGQRFRLALGSAGAPRQWLQELGWELEDPLEVTRTPESYADFIRGSMAEFAVAKHGYTISRCGWFSERSAAYLASGRPVLAQDTGFTSWLPAGEGVLPFSTLDDAVAALEHLDAYYERHCIAAREIAEACFDSSRVLRALLEAAYRPTTAPEPGAATPGRPAFRSTA